MTPGGLLYPDPERVRVILGRDSDSDIGLLTLCCLRVGLGDCSMSTVQCVQASHQTQRCA